MITTEQALNLLETNAPISPNKTDDRYVFVTMRSEGMDNEEIAENLSMDLDYIEEIEEELRNEFLK